MQMNTFLWLALLGMASVASAHFTSGSDFCTDEKDRFDKCKPLVSHDGCGCSNSEEGDSGEIGGSGEISGSGSGSGNGSGWWEGSGSGSGSGSGIAASSEEFDEGDYCYLLQVFINISVTIDIEYREIFITWINKTQLEIVENYNLTEYEKIVEIWYSLQILFTEYYEIEIAIKFVYIGEWGYVCDLEGLAVDIQTSTTEITIEEVIEISGSNGSCPLTEALDECGQSVPGTDQDEIEVLISEITIVIEAGYSFSETLVLIYEKFEVFFKKNAHLKSVVFKWKIKGFGCIQSYYDICATYWRIKNFKLAVGGDVSSCALIEALFELYSNTSYSTSQRSDFKNLHDKIKNYYSTEVSVELRIEYFATQLYQFLILAEWNIKAIYIVEIKGYGSIYQLIYAYIYCQNNGIGEGDFTGGPTDAVTTTTAAATTTVPSGNCGDVTRVNVFSSNTTLVLTSITEAEVSWTSTEVTQFSGYKKRIYNLSANGTITDVQKFSSIKQVFTGFAGSATLKTKIMAIFIKTWGTVSQYCSCSL